MKELCFNEISEIHGGKNILQEVAVGVIGGAAWDAIKGAVGWAAEKAPGGADETTWTNVGNSQMGA
ncbi:hypothetical protein [Chitiniphilus shinanonensis]|uniref:hypothetical protein n=1 Tax=Chitiniphilus shinanonensis TaxID=553088 RepID=UPI00304BF05B